MSETVRKVQRPYEVLKNAPARRASKGLAFDRALGKIPLVTLLEIKSAVNALLPSELAELVAYLHEHDSISWDAQMKQDAATATLDFLFDEANVVRKSDVLDDRLGE